MNCVINDNAEVGEDAVVAALPRRRDSARACCASSRRRRFAGSANTMVEVEVLSKVEAGRRRIDIAGSVPLSELKRQHG